MARLSARGVSNRPLPEGTGVPSCPCGVLRDRARAELLEALCPLNAENRSPPPHEGVGEIAEQQSWSPPNRCTRPCKTSSDGTANAADGANVNSEIALSRFRIVDSPTLARPSRRSTQGVVSRGEMVHVVVRYSVQRWLKRLFRTVSRELWRKGSRKLKRNGELTAAGWTDLISCKASVLPACVRREDWVSVAEEA